MRNSRMDLQCLNVWGVVQVQCVSDGAWRVLLALVSRARKRKKHSPAQTTHSVLQNCPAALS